MHPNYWQITILLVVDLIGLLYVDPTPSHSRQTLVAKQLPTNILCTYPCTLTMHVGYVHTCVEHTYNTCTNMAHKKLEKFMTDNCTGLIHDPTGYVALKLGLLYRTEMRDAPCMQICVAKFWVMVGNSRMLSIKVTHRLGFEPIGNDRQRCKRGPILNSVNSLPVAPDYLTTITINDHTYILIKAIIHVS